MLKDRRTVDLQDAIRDLEADSNASEESLAKLETLRAIWDRLEEIDKTLLAHRDYLMPIHGSFCPPLKGAALEAVRRTNPKAYNAIMEYASLNEEEEEILNSLDLG